MCRRVNCLVIAASICALGGTVRGQGVTAWFPFEDNLLDAVGGTYTTTVTGAPAYVASRAGYGQALQLNAADGNEMIQWANVPKPAALTVSLWVRLDPNTPPSTKTWLLDSLQSVSGVWKGWQFKLQKDAAAGSALCNVQWIWANGTASRRTIYSAVGIYDGQWHHIVGTHDGITTGKLYVDGLYLTQHTTTALVQASAAYPMTLNNIPQIDVLYGVSLIDDIAIWDRALNQAEITELRARGISWPLVVTPADNQNIVALQDSPAPPPVTYTVFNDDAVSRTVEVAECDQNGNPTDYAWLSLSQTEIVDLPASGTATVDAILDHSVLGPGNRTAWVKFTEAASGQVLIRRIAMNVLGCRWTVTPGSVARYYLQGSGDAVSPVAYRITNTGKHGLTYTAQEVVDQPWLTLDKSSGGPLNYGATDTVTASMNPAGLAPGQYTCDIRLLNNCSPADELVATVTLTVEKEKAAPGLLAWYRFEDSMRDWTGNWPFAATAGTINYEEGQYGRSVWFNGQNDPGYVDMGDIPASVPGKPDMTVVLWYRSPGPEIAASWLIDKISSAGGWRGWQIKVGAQWFDLPWEMPIVEFRFCHDGVRDGLSVSNHQVGSPNLYNGRWHQIAMTIEDVDGPGPSTKVNVRGYYDGKLIRGQNIWSQTPEEWVYEALNMPYVPAAADVNVRLSGDTSDHVFGGVDEVSLWDRALSATEIEYMYLNGFIDTRAWPDADTDGDVDMDDFAVLQRCASYGTPAIVDQATCKRFDRNGDDNVTEPDFLEFRNCATGAGVPLDLNSLPAGCKLW